MTASPGNSAVVTVLRKPQPRRQFKDRTAATSQALPEHTAKSAGAPAAAKSINQRPGRRLPLFLAAVIGAMAMAALVLLLTSAVAQAAESMRSDLICMGDTHEDVVRKMAAQPTTTERQLTLGIPAETLIFRSGPLVITVRLIFNRVVAVGTTDIEETKE